MKELNIKSRLHNEADVLEVDDKSLSEAVIPFIEADKDVISKIKVEGSTLIFPEGIIPLRVILSNDDDLYFDYSHDSVVDNGGELLVENIVLTNNSVTVPNTTVFLTKIKGLIYLINNGELSFMDINAFTLFYPQSGTKLYRHEIVMSADIPGLDVSKVVAYTNNQTPFNNASGVDVDLRLGTAITILAGHQLLEYFWVSDTGEDVEYFKIGSATASEYSGAFAIASDSVTPL